GPAHVHDDGVPPPPERAAPFCPRPPLPLPLHDPPATEGDGRVVGPHARGRVPAAGGPGPDGQRPVIWTHLVATVATTCVQNRESGGLDPWQGLLLRAARGRRQQGVGRVPAPVPHHLSPCLGHSMTLTHRG